MDDLPNSVELHQFFQFQITHDPKGSADVLIVKQRDGKTTVHDGRRALDGAQWLKILAGASSWRSGCPLRRRRRSWSMSRASAGICTRPATRY